MMLLNLRGPVQHLQPAEAYPPRLDLRRARLPQRIAQAQQHHHPLARAQPCWFCKQLLYDAHYLKFAKPQALGRKVSDEFTVPACCTHHQELDSNGIERLDGRTSRSLTVSNELWAGAYRRSADGRQMRSDSVFGAWNSSSVAMDFNMTKALQAIAIPGEFEVIAPAPPARTIHKLTQPGARWDLAHRTVTRVCARSGSWSPPWSLRYDESLRAFATGYWPRKGNSDSHCACPVRIMALCRRSSPTDDYCSAFVREPNDRATTTRA